MISLHNPQVKYFHYVVTIKAQPTITRREHPKQNPNANPSIKADYNTLIPSSPHSISN
jgi:hypothetical protein